jgi:hypothetical protein
MELMGGAAFDPDPRELPIIDVALPGHFIHNASGDIIGITAP